MSDRKGQYTKKDGYSENIAVQAGLNFNKTLGEHLFFANLTWNIATSNSRSTSTVGEGFGNDSMDDLSFATKYEKNGKPTGNNGKTREVGVIGALNYAYANRYLFDASIRKSASSGLMVVILDGELFGHWGLVGIFTMRSFWREIIG